jgi:hypothetical protein
LIHDIETPHSRSIDSDEDDEEDPSYQILRFSLARDDFHAITAPFQEPFITMWKAIMAEPMDKVGWNSSSFDDPREVANDIPMAGRRIDVQWLAHALNPTLPRGLGHRTTYYARCPMWKHLGGEDECLYSAMDAWATAHCYAGIRKALEARRV